MPKKAPSNPKIMELLISYYQSPSIELRNKLVRLNVGLVRKVAHRLIHQCNESFEDLEQVGYMGLIQAIERFDPTQGNAFSSFAVPYIRGEILHYLRDRSNTVKIPRRWQDLERGARKARMDLIQRLGRFPNDTEMAAELNIPTSEWQQMKVATSNRSPLSLDATVNDERDGLSTLGDLLPDPQLQKLLSWEEERTQIHYALSHIEVTTRCMIELVYFQGLSQKVIAKRFGVSPITVSRRLKRGLEDIGDLLKQADFAPAGTPQNV